MQQYPNGNNMFKNDGSFLEQFHKSNGLLPNPSTAVHQVPSQTSEHLSGVTAQPFTPPWFPSTSQPPFPLPPMPFNPCEINHCSSSAHSNCHCNLSAQLPPLPPPPPSFNAASPFFPPPPSVSNNPSSFAPPPFIPPPFPLPPPELFSKLLQNAPPPLPVPPPPPVNNPPTSVKTEDLYDPLQAEDEAEEDTEQTKMSAEKPATAIFNIKKEHTIKIEPSNSSSASTQDRISAIFSRLEQPACTHSHRKCCSHFYRQLRTVPAPQSPSVPPSLRFPRLLKKRSLMPCLSSFFPRTRTSET